MGDRDARGWLGPCLGMLCVLLATRGWAGTPATGFSEADVVTGLTAPTGIAFLPDGRMLVTQQSGELLLASNGSTTTLATLPACFSDFDPSFETETGLLGIAVHPDFPSDRSVYLYWTAKPPGFLTCLDALFSFSGSQLENKISRVTLAEDDTVDLGGMTTVLGGIRADTGFHNGGGLRIGPDDRLYVGVGDSQTGDDDSAPGSSTNPYAQDRGELEGKILRLDLDGSAPTDNPFYGQAGARDEVFAYGFRNPWRFGFDPMTGKLWVGDVGQETREEIDCVTAGGNYGWPRCEGTLPDGCQQPGDVAPAFEYPHAGAGTLGVSVIGGALPSGGAFAGFGDYYFFGDFGEGPPDGAIYWAPVNAARDGFATAPQAVITGANGPVDLVFGPDGALYYIAIFEGAVKRVTTSLDPPSGPGPGGACATIADCQGAVDAARPNPDTVDDKKVKRFAKKLAKFDKKADKALAKAAGASGKKQARQYKKARKFLAKLLKTARKADKKGRLGVDLAALEAAINTLLGQIPTS